MKQLLKAMIVQPLGLPTLERTQEPGEILLTGQNGHYFITKEKTCVYCYEYFGIRGLKSGYAHLTKKDTLEMLQNRLDRNLDSEQLALDFLPK